MPDFRAVIDTNVLISGIFFGGMPGRILDALQAERFSIVASPLILNEYRRVVSDLSARFPLIEIEAILDLITIHARIVEDTTLPQPICRDPYDDKFLICAAVGNAVLVTGDKDLIAVNGALGVRILTPRKFQAMLDDLTSRGQT